MKRSLLPLFLPLVCVVMGCSNAAREKELELRERELELREKELDMRTGADNQNSEGGSITDTYSGNQSSQPKTSGQSVQQSNHQPTEQELKLNLYNKEASSPKSYLSVEYTYKVNLAFNTIIEGRIYNSASMAGFKNVQVTVYFYSKTDRLLGRETFTVMEFVPQSNSVAFRYKIEGWWDNVAYSNYSIVSAEPY